MKINLTNSIIVMDEGHTTENISKECKTIKIKLSDI